MNLKRHKILKFLTKETLKNELNKNETGVDYSLIYDFLKCNKIEYLEITTTLFNNNEIQRYDVGNYFPTEEMANDALSKYKEFLKLFHKNI